MTTEYFSTLPEVERQRYVTKVELITKKKFDEALDPYQIADWVDDISLWPPVEFGSLYAYLIETPGEFTKDTLKAFKSLEAYNYYSSGWVQTVFYHRIETNAGVCLLKAKVRPSQRLNDVPHEAWTAVDSSGSVLTGHCTCMAGCGEVCSHVAAILFKVEACIRLEIAAKSCTSLPCLWNQQTFSKKIEPTTVSDICFQNPVKKRRQLEHPPLAVHDVPENLSEHISFDDQPRVGRQDILNKFYTVCPSAAIFTILPGFGASISDDNLNNDCEAGTDDPQHPEHLVPVTAGTNLELHIPETLCNLFDPQRARQEPRDIDVACRDIFDGLSVTQEQAKNLCTLTKNQSKSKLWFDHRFGRITASQMHNVLKYSGRKYPSSIIKSIMQYSVVNEDLPPLKWGRDNESVARDDYVREMERSHTNFKCSLSGLVIDPLLPYLGASPDGTASCDCCGDRILEIKCPYRYRDLPPTHDDPLSNTRFCLTHDEDGKVILSRQHCYYTQIQGQLLVTHEKYCDFICWTTKGMFVEKIYEDKNFQNILLPKLKAFFQKFVLPELVTHHFIDGKLTPDDLDADNETDEGPYCYCGEGAHGYMIACDGENCEMEWFHYACVGIKCRPKGKWYCRNCK